MTHLLVANPTAQSGKNAQRIDRALAWMKRARIACDVLPTLPDGETITAVRWLAMDATYTTGEIVRVDGGRWVT